MIDRLMKPRKLDSLRYAFYDLDFFWRRRSESRVSFAGGLLFVQMPMGWRYRFGRCTLCGGIVCVAFCRVSRERDAKKDRKTYECCA